MGTGPVNHVTHVRNVPQTELLGSECQQAAYSQLENCDGEFNAKTGMENVTFLHCHTHSSENISEFSL